MRKNEKKERKKVIDTRASPASAPSPPRPLCLRRPSAGTVLGTGAWHTHFSERRLPPEPRDRGTAEREGEESGKGGRRGPSTGYSAALPRMRILSKIASGRPFARGEGTTAPAGSQEMLLWFSSSAGCSSGCCVWVGSGRISRFAGLFWPEQTMSCRPPWYCRDQGSGV